MLRKRNCFDKEEHLVWIRADKRERRVDKDNQSIMREQLSYNGSDFFKRIPSICVDCKANKAYKIWIQKITGLGSHVTGGLEYVYWIKCTKCNDAFEMTESDYMMMKPFINLNIKLEEGKIDLDQYQIKNDKFLMKLAKKKKMV